MIDFLARRQLEAIYSLFQKIERESKDGFFDADDLQELEQLLLGLKTFEEPKVSKLADLTKHLHAEMTLRTFVNLLIPVERALGKSLADDDFLVTSADTDWKVGESFPVHLALENLRSAFNVGSLLRTADGLGVEGVHLLGYTPGPDEFKTSKTALGAQNVVAWDRCENIAELRAKLPAQTWIVALETVPSAKPLHDPFPQVPTVFIVGNERFGLSKKALEQADEVRRLPMEGQKNSMNVGVVAALAIYEWKRQWNPS